MELNIFVSKQDLINGTRTTAHSAINHALFMINIPADQLSGEVWTGLASYLPRSTTSLALILIVAAFIRLLCFYKRKSKYVTGFSVAYFIVVFFLIYVRI